MDKDGHQDDEHRPHHHHSRFLMGLVLVLIGVVLGGGGVAIFIISSSISESEAMEASGEGALLRGGHSLVARPQSQQEKLVAVAAAAIIDGAGGVKLAKGSSLLWSSWPSFRQSSHEDIYDEEGEDSREMIKVVATHHKTGTELSIKLLKTAQEVHRSLHQNESNGVLMGYFNTKGLDGDDDDGMLPSFFFMDAIYSKEAFKNRPDDWWEHYSPKEIDFHHFFQGGRRLAVVHLVRDPVDLVVSSYLYHKGGPPPAQEPWLYEQQPPDHFAWALDKSASCHPGPDKTTLSWHDVLQCMDEREGVAAEAVFQTTSLGTIPSMIAAVKGLRQREKETGARYLQLSLEDFSSDWDGTLTRIFTFFRTEPQEMRLILNKSAVHDLSRTPASALANSTHVTSRNSHRGRLLHILEEEVLPGNPTMMEARRLFGKQHHHTHTRQEVEQQGASLTRPS